MIRNIFSRMRNHLLDNRGDESTARLTWIAIVFVVAAIILIIMTSSFEGPVLQYTENVNNDWFNANTGDYQYQDPNSGYHKPAASPDFSQVGGGSGAVTPVTPPGGPSGGSGNEELPEEYNVYFQGCVGINTIGGLTIAEGEELILTIEAEAGYTLPNRINVVNATFDWVKETGYLRILNAYGPVYIEIVSTN
jgi:hypothetical protein